MQIAILGGTGDVGEGLALRWGYDTDHEVIVGSRDTERAREAASSYESKLAEHGRDVTIEGAKNPEAAAGADAVVAAVPAYHLTDTIKAVADKLDDAVLVTPAVGMQRDEDGFHYNPPSAGSVTALAAGAAPEDTTVVGAFHNLAAGRLADLDDDLEIDTLLVGDDDDAKATVADLADDIEGLRPLDAGGLANAPEIEGITPLLINVAQHNDGLHDLGVRFE
ncbi:NADPH-dependent F420 reductase [Halapricum desulfuricans]|uniref:Putative dinucleotide-binding enzyme n=1 Tax=Halapricum desulfuricans TaxID=2841257 RepID=A0A897NRR8_9EURY|nr:NADPH-dependent F420 reductase [Halapricum desulfuricans]QSG15522.1 putative dinucleotide-binding enzyme [Halapricum desulfuricans]